MVFIRGFETGSNIVQSPELDIDQEHKICYSYNILI